MHAVQYEIFSPDDADPVDVVFMPNIMGGALDFPVHEMGDHAYRAQYVARELVSHVVAYERPGTGRSVFDMAARSAVQPSQYVLEAAGRASELQKAADSLGVRRTVIAGPSAAGTDAIALAQTECLALDAVAVYDPIGVRNTTWAGGFGDWVHHQKIESRRPVQARNLHPMEAPSPSLGALQAVAGLARTAVEMYRYGNVWRHDVAYEGLQTLINDKRYGRIALLAELPNVTFTAASADMRLLARTLQHQIDTSQRLAPAAVSLVRKYHSWTDDPANLADLVHRAQLLAA